jgi:hypothetical protein
MAPAASHLLPATCCQPPAASHLLPGSITRAMPHHSRACLQGPSAGGADLSAQLSLGSSGRRSPSAGRRVPGADSAPGSGRVSMGGGGGAQQPGQYYSNQGECGASPPVLHACAHTDAGAVAPLPPGLVSSRLDETWTTALSHHEPSMLSQAC